MQLCVYFIYGLLCNGKKARAERGDVIFWVSVYRAHSLAEKQIIISKYRFKIRIY